MAMVTAQGEITTHNTRAWRNLEYAADLGSAGGKPPWGFESPRPHLNLHSNLSLRRVTVQRLVSEASTVFPDTLAPPVLRAPHR